MIPPDDDSDGVADSVENGAPNSGDGNNDGTPDSEQGNVASLPNAEDAQYVTLVSPSGTNITGVQAIGNPSSGDAPTGVSFPVGFFEFTVEGIPVGGPTTVTQFLPTGTTMNSYYKYGPTPGNPVDHWYEFAYDGTTGAVISMDMVVLHFVDGQRGDDDLTANGVIVEPGGAALVPLVSNVAPVVGEITTAVVVEVNTLTSASAAFTDADQGDTHTATWDWGDTITSAGIIVETAGVGNATGSHSYDTPGVYIVSVTVTDNDGASDTSIFEFVVVYDATGGFVTGGGWIDSPGGAYVPDPSMTGKANFGFFSKYKKGAATPMGQTEFTFSAGDLNFQSDSYDWLVIAGAKAMYKGTGTINGTGSYAFQLTAIDGEISGGGGVDKFRIKIKDADDGVIYDNQPGVGDNENPSTALGGGSIKIHKGK